MKEVIVQMIPFECEGNHIAETRDRVNANAHKTVVIGEDGNILDSEITCRIKTKAGECQWSHPIRECYQLQTHKVTPTT